MASLFVWCILAVLSDNNYAVSFMLSGNHKGSRLAVSRLHSNLQAPLYATSNSLSDISDEILAIVQSRNMSGGAAGLTVRPGYTFGLGCDEWEASSYSGTIEGWNSEPLIRWVSRSLLRELPYQAKSLFLDSDSDNSETDAIDAKARAQAKAQAADSDIVRAVRTRLDLHFSVGSSVDVPHMRMSISEAKDGYSVLLDYTPRVELVSNMEYFDKYFEDLEGSLSALLSPHISSGLMRPMAPQSALSKMLQSPFAVSATVESTGTEIVKGLCVDYAARWCSWLDAATADIERERVVKVEEVAANLNIDGLNDADGDVEKKRAEEEKELKQQKLVSMYNRDQRLQKLYFEEQKYELAEVMGSSFAPKAAELAAAIVGPSIGLSSYSLY